MTDRCRACADIITPCAVCGAVIVEASGEWSADFARHAAELRAREPEIMRAVLGAAPTAEAPSSGVALASRYDDARRGNPFPLTTPELRR